MPSTPPRHHDQLCSHQSPTIALHSVSGTRRPHPDPDRSHPPRDGDGTHQEQTASTADHADHSPASTRQHHAPAHAPPPTPDATTPPHQDSNRLPTPIPPDSHPHPPPDHAQTPQPHHQQPHPPAPIPAPHRLATATGRLATPPPTNPETSTSASCHRPREPHRHSPQLNPYPQEHQERSLHPTRSPVRATWRRRRNPEPPQPLGNTLTPRHPKADQTRRRHPATTTLPPKRRPAGPRALPTAYLPRPCRRPPWTCRRWDDHDRPDHRNPVHGCGKARCPEAGCTVVAASAACPNPAAHPGRFHRPHTTTPTRCPLASHARRSWSPAPQWHRPHP